MAGVRPTPLYVPPVFRDRFKTVVDKSRVCRAHAAHTRQHMAALLVAVALLAAIAQLPKLARLHSHSRRALQAPTAANRDRPLSTLAQSVPLARITRSRAKTAVCRANPAPPAHTPPPTLHATGALAVPRGHISQHTAQPRAKHARRGRTVRRVRQRPSHASRAPTAARRIYPLRSSAQTVLLAMHAARAQQCQRHARRAASLTRQGCQSASLCQAATTSRCRALPTSPHAPQALTVQRALLRRSRAPRVPMLTPQTSRLPVNAPTAYWATRARLARRRRRRARRAATLQ